MNTLFRHTALMLGITSMAYCTNDYQKGSYLHIEQKNGMYEIRLVKPCCIGDTTHLYRIEDCQAITGKDGSIVKKIIAVQDTTILPGCGIALYKKMVTIPDIEAALSLRSGPGGPAINIEMRPNAQGFVAAFILSLGLGGIFYKMATKIKELENSRIA